MLYRMGTTPNHTNSPGGLDMEWSTLPLTRGVWGVENNFLKIVGKKFGGYEKHCLSLGGTQGGLRETYSYIYKSITLWSLQLLRFSSRFLRLWH